MADIEDRPKLSCVDLQLEESLASVREVLSSLRYGSVLLIVHEGRLVQLDVTEKKRLTPS